MTLTEARRGLKSRLDIDPTVKDFDQFLDQAIKDGIDRLSPAIFDEIDPQTVTTFSTSDIGTVTIDLAELDTPITTVRRVELVVSATATSTDDFRQHRTTLTIRDVPSDTTSIIIYGLAPFTIDTVPREFNMAVYWYGMADFYTFLLSNKSKYNTYMQNGRAAIDDMRELVEFFEDKATALVEEKSTLYGH